MKYSNHIQCQTTAGPHVNQLVVNWHLTEACNYSCRYCYSRWGQKQSNGELFHDGKASRWLLCELYDFFSPRNASNPLQAHLKWDDLRLSLAGGEPLLYPHQTLQIAEIAKDIGFKVSVITNGSHLSQKGLEPLFASLSMLGISFDSMVPATCRQIGRTDSSIKVLCADGLAKTMETVRAANPGVLLKINTVVNKLNYQEDLSEMAELLKPDKWKILKVLPVASNDLTLSEREFQSFVERHRHLEHVMSVENNQEMTESYLMVDPHGRFFQNKPNIKAGDSYIYSQPIHLYGAATAFRQINFDVKKFVARYPLSTEEVAA